MNKSTDNTKSNPQDTGTAPRVRTQSESSLTSDDGASSSSTGKRQRTTSQQYFINSGLTSASPPKFVSLEEIMQAANGMKDISLMHHIVVDENFTIEKVDPEPDSLEKKLKDNMQKAFWDILRSELNEEPPCYKQAMVLLDDIKKGLFAVLLPQHTKLKQQISEILDDVLIKQQAENGTLDFAHYAQYVISVMAKLCAPVRDEKIKELTQTTDVVDTFKGILETLDLMKLDMANFTLAMVKPDIIARSAELERKKFADFLAIQPGDGLENTRSWLMKHVEIDDKPDNITREDFIRSILKKAFWRACIDLLEWDENKPYPETFIIDEIRLKQLKLKTNKIAAIGTILLVTLSNAGTNLQSITEFKISLKSKITLLMQSFTKESDLKELLPNITEQIINDLKEAKHTYFSSDLKDDTFIRQQILQIEQSDHKIRNLVKQRIKEFLQEIIKSSTAAPQKVPSGLSALQQELTTIAGQFLRIVSHNNTVYSNYYYDIIDAIVP